MSVLAPIAQCVLNFIYAAAVALLLMLKAFIESMLLFIDAKITELRALIAMTDLTKLAAEAVWAFFEALLDQLKNSLLGGIQDLGPASDLCPEFYEYFTDPVVALLDSFSVFGVYKEVYVNAISMSSQFNKLLVYWETTKAVFVALIEVIDDAILLAKEREAADLKAAEEGFLI